MKKTEVLYSKYKKLPRNAYHEFCYFYKTNKSTIEQMEFGEYIEIRYDYIRALFYTDEYPSLHKEADRYLVEILNDQHFDEQSRGFYINTILLKAKAFLNHNQPAKAIGAYKELVKLAPHNRIFKRTLFGLCYQRHYLQGKKALAVVILMVLVSLFCNALLIFFVQPFYPDSGLLLEGIRNSTFIIGSLLFLACHTTYLCRAIREIRNSA
ncbi:MAG: hypothetical protein IPM34_01560 [Saprospiraceae bacterium]|nr:hypothetical protein [Saprospiraceae bacterium]